MKFIVTEDQGYEKSLADIINRGKERQPEVEATVAGIVQDVAAHGDEALFRYTRQFDHVELNNSSVEVTPDEMDLALDSLNPEISDILRFAAERIEAFHRRQLIDSWFFIDDEGAELGQLIRPLDRIAVYAPGGLAPYPSTVLMAAIPARIAGVKEIILATPARQGTINPVICAAAGLAGVTRIFKIGGAQAVAALAYGTESVPAVDKIVGPGNIYVATAKRMVYGKTGIDMIAGPSEILIVSDGTAPAAVVAADLLSQAEHDEMASSVLLTPCREFALSVKAEVEAQLKQLSRAAIAGKSIERYGAVIVTRDMDEAMEIANAFAPEHLEIVARNARDYLGKVKNAGAVFLGDSAPEALGDYTAGTNHILPTGGTARFSSPLGVYDFVKRTSVITFNERSLQQHGKKAAAFAMLEGLEAHAQSIEIRLK